MRPNLDKYKSVEKSFYKEIDLGDETYIEVRVVAKINYILDGDNFLRLNTEILEITHEGRSVEKALSFKNLGLLREIAERLKIHEGDE